MRRNYHNMIPLISLYKKISLNFGIWKKKYPKVAPLKVPFNNFFNPLYPLSLADSPLIPLTP